MPPKMTSQPFEDLEREPSPCPRTQARRGQGGCGCLPHAVKRPCFYAHRWGDLTGLLPNLSLDPLVRGKQFEHV